MFPLSTIDDWFQWRVYKVLPYPGHPRTWPADYAAEWQLVNQHLRGAEQQLDDELGEAE